MMVIAGLFFLLSGALLLEAVVSSCPDGINAILEATQKRFSEPQQEKASGSAVWWRMREAVIFSLSFLSEPLAEILGSSRSSFGSFLEQILTEDIATGVHEYPFLHARAFSAVAKFSSLVNPRILEQFMQAAAKAISLDVPAAVKVGACQALSELLPDTDKGVIQPQIMDLFSSLMDLLKHASDDTLHLILETLQKLSRQVISRHEAIITIEPIISPVMLNLWAMHIADPFRTDDIVEVLEAVKNAPQCMWPLVSRVLPSIGPILEKPQQQPEGLVAGSLDLITMLLKGNVILCSFRNGAIVTVDVRQQQQGCPGGVSKHRIPFSSNKSHGNPSKNTNKRPKGWFELKGSIHPSSTIFMPSSISSLISLQTDDQYFLASSMDGSIKLYVHRLIQRGPIQSYKGHVNSHSRIQLGVDPAERLLMSGGEDGKVRTWSIKTGELLFGEKISNSVPTTLCWTGSIGEIGKVPVVLAKSQAYMNYSGESVGSLSRYYQIHRRRILLIYDDMSLANGVMSLVPKGGLAHHNGVKSVIQHLNGCRAFPRLCIGIGNPPRTMDMRAFLLQKFSSEERKQI